LSEEEFDCVFGYGKCPVRAHIRREQKELMQFVKAYSIPPEELSPEMKELYSQAMMVLGPFCQACPKLRKVNSR